MMGTPKARRQLTSAARLNTLCLIGFIKGTKEAQLMAPKRTSIRVEVDRETDLEFSEWSGDEGRSKRRHLEIVLRKLARLRKSNPGELARLGLLDPAAALN
jgi:hypothetical protein